MILSFNLKLSKYNNVQYDNNHLIIVNGEIFIMKMFSLLFYVYLINFITYKTNINNNINQNPIRQKSCNPVTDPTTLPLQLLFYGRMGSQICTLGPFHS